MSASGYVVGIDLGTTFTAAAVHRNGRTEIAPLGNRAASIPSLVFLREDQEVLTGEAAERRGAAEPNRLAREFKRRVGDSAPILLGEAPYSAERLMAALLKQVLSAVATREGGPPERVAVSHPANWGPYKIDLLRHAVDLAGLRDAVLLTEPIAAAIQYASAERVEVGSLVAVYDLGGGTFDAAILRKTDSGFTTIGEPEGIERLGGIDFDEAVFAYARRALDGQIEQLDPGDPQTRAALQRFRQDCVAAKEALSFDTDATISVLLPNVQTELRITRAEFEPMIRPALSETIEALRRAMERAGVIRDQLDAVLLVGGSSQIPLVAEMISQELGRPVAVDAHPKHSIALGAAIAAANAVKAQGSGQATPARVLAPVAAVEAPNPPAPPAPAPPAPVIPAFPATHAPPHATVPPPAPPHSLLPTGPVPPGPKGGRGKVLAAVAAMVVIAGGAVFAVTALGSDDPGTQADSTTTSVQTSSSVPVTEPALDCESVSGRCAFITEVTLDGDTYVAEYEPIDFDPLIFVEGSQGNPDDHHVHFFFNTTEPENAGTNGNPPGQWQIWDRPMGDGRLQFDAFTTADAGDATQLCVAVADADHAVETPSGNCVDLPSNESSAGERQPVLLAQIGSVGCRLPA